ncbi:MAG: hypothetical protein V8Q84_00400 [Bilophila sp.]
MAGPRGPCRRSRKQHSIGWSAAFRKEDAVALSAAKALRTIQPLPSTRLFSKGPVIAIN